MKYLIIWQTSTINDEEILSYNRFESFSDFKAFGDELLYIPNCKILFAGRFVEEYAFELVPKNEG